MGLQQQNWDKTSLLSLKYQVFFKMNLRLTLMGSLYISMILENNYIRKNDPLLEIL